MKAYNKPEFYVEEFILNDVVAATTCSHVPATGPNSQITVYCEIGGQSETVFTDTLNCKTNSTNYGTVEDYNGSTDDYFVWEAGMDGSGSKPTDAQMSLLSALVSIVTGGQVTSGKGWHYAGINMGTQGYDTFQIS